MATIEIRGYVSKPEAKTTAGGKQYSQYTVGVKQVEKAYKDKPEKVTWANYRVKDWHNSSPPTEKAYVTVKGYLTVNEVDLNGTRRTFLDVNAAEVEVAPPRDGSPNSGISLPSQAAPSGVPAKDPWE